MTAHGDRFRATLVAAILVLSVVALGTAFAGSVVADEHGGVLVVDGEGQGEYEYATIQEAVDAAEEGDTVQVEPGTYEELVVINTSLTLQADQGATIRSPAEKDGYGIPENDNIREPVVFAYGGDETDGNISGAGTIAVDITGFTVDGNDIDPGAGDEVSTGILFRNVNGAITETEVTNMHEGGGETFGIIVYGDSTVDVVGNDVSGYERGGIGIQGADGFPAPDGVVRNNTVSGPGAPVGGWAANGIQMALGATGEVVNNTVTGHLHDSAEPGGILAFASQEVVIEDNLLQENVDGIQVFGDTFFGTGLDALDTTVRNNTVESSTNAGVTVGPASAGTNVIENEIRDNEIGLEIFGEAADIEELRFTENNVVGNNAGVLNFFDYTVEATGNWWGDATGPGGEGPGDGDSVDDTVIFEPWYVDAERTTLSNEIEVVDGSPASDTTGDGLLNDVNGDEDFTIADVQELFLNLDTPVVQDNAALFNFAGVNDERVSVFDIQALFTQLQTPQVTVTFDDQIAEPTEGGWLVTVEDVDSAGEEATLVVTYEVDGDEIVAGIQGPGPDQETDVFSGEEETVALMDDGLPGDHTAHLIPADEFAGYEPGDIISAETADSILVSDSARISSLD